jgi:hypothetical protein
MECGVCTIIQKTRGFPGYKSSSTIPQYHFFDFAEMLLYALLALLLALLLAGGLLAVIIYLLSQSERASSVLVSGLANLFPITAAAQACQQSPAPDLDGESPGLVVQGSSSWTFRYTPTASGMQQQGLRRRHALQQEFVGPVQAENAGGPQEMVMIEQVGTVANPQHAV